MNQTMLTREEFDRLWHSGQYDKIWNRDMAIAWLEEMTKYPSGNKFTRAAARCELHLLHGPSRKAR